MPLEYCRDKCPSCKETCRLTSRHGHNLGRWKHICSKNKNHTWDVEFMPTKDQM